MRPVLRYRAGLRWFCCRPICRPVIFVACWSGYVSMGQNARPLFSRILLKFPAHDVFRHPVLSPSAHRGQCYEVCRKANFP